MVLVLNIWARRQYPFEWIRRLMGWFASLCVVASYIFWSLGLLTKSSCEKDGWFSGHTWWHILSGVALYLQWRYFDHQTPAHGDGPADAGEPCL
jgi:hypothetical protein